MTVPRRRSDKRRSTGRRCAALTTALILSFQSAGCAAQSGPTKGRDVHSSIEILALSRGRGVPKETRAAFDRIKSSVARMRREGAVIESKESVVGLEGETRLCVIFKDQEAARAAQSELGEIGAAVDLLRIRNVDCRTQ